MVRITPFFVALVALAGVATASPAIESTDSTLNTTVATPDSDVASRSGKVCRCFL